MLLFIKILILIITLAKTSSSALKIDKRFLLQPRRLPEDLNFMPSLSNGHLGFTVFGDAIYMNGVYNGHKGDSRRARLPNWLNITANVLNLPSGNHLRSDIMNLYEGFYEWTECLQYQQICLRQRMYAHRYYNRALIYELEVKRDLVEDSLNIELQLNPGTDTNAFNIIPENSNSSNLTVLRCVTKQPENEHFQANPTSLYVAISDKFPQNRKKLQLSAGQTSLNYRYVLTADLQKAVALKEMQDVLSLSENAVLEKHSSCWQEFWNNFQIEVQGNEELSKIINAAIFYLANSLPSLKTNQKNNPYFGLSPTGLGRGQLDDDYEGHNFWDTEIWMLPVVTQMQPYWSQQLFQYRLDHLQGALYNANITGFQGARFPWESAYTGTEVTNPCCPEVATQEIHISADIAIALEQFYTTFSSRDWLCQTAWPLIRKIAEFLQSRVTWNEQTNQYHIKNVMGPDEDHENVDDNVYTNMAFKQALKFARYTHLKCDPKASDNSLDWLNISNNMFILYDKERNYHPQHVGYLPGVQVKQADTILLGYPLQFLMANSTRFNDLTMYENVTRHSGPAMTWSMFALNFLDIGLKDKADFYFLKGYKDYVRPEFKVWSETKIGLKGSANFLTGIGGFLQSIINGYAGIRFQLEHLTAKMLIKRIHLLPHTRGLTIKGLKFANSTFDLHIKENGLNTIECLKLGNQPLEVQIGNGQFLPLFAKVIIQFQTELITIQTIN